MNLTRNADDINLKGTMLVLVNGNIAGVKRRSNTRLMLDFSIKGLSVLKRERESLGKDFDTIAAKYYDMSRCYCLNGKHHIKLQKAF